MRVRVFFAAILFAASSTPFAQAQTAGAGTGTSTGTPGGASSVHSTPSSQGNANGSAGPLKKGKVSSVLTQTESERREQEKADHDMNICKGC